MTKFSEMNKYSKITKAYQCHLNQFMGPLKIIGIYVINDNSYIYEVIEKCQKHKWYILNENRMGYLKHKDVVKKRHYIQFQNKTFRKIFDSYLITLFHDIYLMIVSNFIKSN